MLQTQVHRNQNRDTNEITKTSSLIPTPLTQCCVCPPTNRHVLIHHDGKNHSELGKSTVRWNDKEIMISIKSILFIFTYSATWGVTVAHTRFAVPSSSRAFLVQQRQQIPAQQLVDSILVRGGAGYYDDGDDDPYYSQDPRGRNNDNYNYDERDNDYPPSVRLKTE